MGLFDFFKPKEQEPARGAPAQLLNDQPYFSQFGDSIYGSDVVQNCIDIIATECSKMMPKHIVITDNGEQRIAKSSINRLFSVAPNELMTTRDFLEKIIWLLYLNYNSFIYPEYQTYKASDGVRRKRFVAFWPLNPYQVDFEQDPAGRIVLHFYFRNGQDYRILYSEVVHLRKKFSVNDVMGGGEDGQPDNDALLEILRVNDIVLQGVGKAVETSLAIRGILKLNSMFDDGSQQKERERFEAALKANESGIMPIDLKGDYTPITADPKAIDKDTMEFLDQKVLRWYRVSLPIISGDFNDEQYQAFYETALEPILVGLSQAFTKTVFSQREQDIGNRIQFYQKNMMYLSMDHRLQILETAGAQGLLTDDQKLLLLGQPPIGGEEGNRKTQSLNFANVNIVDAYQINKAAGGGQIEE